MQNNIQIFESKDFGSVRVIQKDTHPWWVLKDICKALKLTTPSCVAERLDEDEVRLAHITDSIGRKQKTIIVNESGLYAVILRSDKPNAKAFRKWITQDVLPSIRKFGAYATSETLRHMEDNPEIIATLIHNLTESYSRNLNLLEQVDKLKPKALYCDVILQYAKAVPVTFIAKDYGMTAQAFNKLLHRLKIQYRLGDAWFLYKDYANQGYTVTKTYYVDRKIIAIHTSWTQKGRFWLYNTLKTNGIVPVIERLGEVI